MYSLHIYNPEHDIALARNDRFFTPPKAARLTRAAYGHLPALWADDGDWILVDDPLHAEKKLREEESAGRRFARVRFVTFDDLRQLSPDQLPHSIQPWGWDRAVVGQLLRANPLLAPLLPDEGALDAIREMSSRVFASEKILPALVGASSEFVGESRVFRGSVGELETALASMMPRAVLKSPWSCSGRGVRFVGDGSLTPSERGWARNVLAEQGCIMIEPYYECKQDFALEFFSSPSGTKYLGLNIFTTSRAAFLSSLSASEQEKFEILSSRISSPSLLSSLIERIVALTSNLFREKYTGPFGIDMMLVASPEPSAPLLIHPCVELNLRRTMGHAALL